MPIQSLAELENLIYITAVTMTGYDADNVRLSYQPGGQPPFKVDDNIVFYHLEPVDNPYNAQIHEHHEYVGPDPGDPGDELLHKAQYTRVMDAVYSCYGPGGYDMANIIRFKLMTPAIHKVMKVSGVYPVAHPPSPRIIREPANGQWFQRADLRAQLYVDTINEQVAYSLASATIKLINKDGQFAEIEVPPSP